MPYLGEVMSEVKPKFKTASEELDDLLCHHYTLAEFYDDLVAHCWAQAASSQHIDRVIKYNGDEFRQLYVAYSKWVMSPPGTVVLPVRPPDEYDDE